MATAMPAFFVLLGLNIHSNATYHSGLDKALVKTLIKKIKFVFIAIGFYSPLKILKPYILLA